MGFKVLLVHQGKRLIQQRKLIVTAHPHKRPLSYCRESISDINANNPCLHLKSNASQQRWGISMVVFYLDIGWSPTLITKNKDGFQVHYENQNFVSIVTNINDFKYAGIHVLQC